MAVHPTTKKLSIIAIAVLIAVGAGVVLVIPGVIGRFIPAADACAAIADDLEKTGRLDEARVLQGEPIGIETLRMMIPGADEQTLADLEGQPVLRFDYNGDGIADLVAQRTDGTAGCTVFLIHKGLPGDTTFAAEPIAREAGCGRNGAWGDFLRVDGATYLLQGKADPMLPETVSYTLTSLPAAKRALVCTVELSADWTKPTTIKTCETPVCAEVARRAPELTGSPAALWAGQAIPFPECRQTDWYEGAWAIDFDNDGQAEIYIRQKSSDGTLYWESFLGANTPIWKDCQDPAAHRWVNHQFEPSERWSGWHGEYLWLNAVVMEGKTYVLTIDLIGNFDHRISIVRVEGGAVTPIGHIDHKPRTRIAIRRAS